jgi:hypothetical protein
MDKPSGIDGMIISRINNRREVIRSSESLDAAIEVYYDVIQQVYLANPLYFKMIFKADRLVVLMSILGGYYTLGCSSFRDVKKFCIRNDLLSSNTLDSFVSFLGVGKRLEIARDKQDKRRLTYKPTERSLSEVRELIYSLLAPYAVICPEFDLEYTLGHDDFTAVFLKNYAQVISSELFIYDAVPDSREFVTRDAGHIIMFNLYIESVRKKTLSVQYNYLNASARFSVSRSHIKRCFQAAERLDLLNLRQDGRTIELKPRFIAMVRDTFCFYLASAEYGALGAC